MFDCIIVGAGPAGGTAAYHLAKRGHSVLVIEKAELPRYKPCGGGVSPEVQQWFDFDFSPVISAKVKGGCYTWNCRESLNVPFTDIEPFWMVRRDKFDNFLIEKAKEKGAIIQDKTKVFEIDFKGDRWELETSNKPAMGRFLIAADGGKSTLANLLGFKKRRHRLVGALEIEVMLDPAIKNELYFEFGKVKGGYLWNFPKADGYSMGIATFRGSKRYDFRQLVADYGKSFDVETTNSQHWGHPIYVWDGNQQLHTSNAILAGEAACVVDPFTLEGIRPAMFSGMKAAEAIDSAIIGNPNALENYTQTMSEEWGKEMIWAKRLGELFYRFPKLSYQLLVKQPSMAKTMNKIFSGDLRYSQVAQRGINRLLEKVKPDFPFGG
ncbi:MAG: geranylgeranyl reductase family protein [Chroococcales cyanobacterium]